MQFLAVLPVLIVSALATPHGYVVPPHHGKLTFAESLRAAVASSGIGRHFNNFDYNEFSGEIRPIYTDGFGSSGIGLGNNRFRSFDGRFDDQSQSFGPNFGFGQCAEGEVVNIDGSCDKPLVTRNFFLYAAPPQPFQEPPNVKIPKPRVNYNVVFIRNPEDTEDLDPIVVPPPQQKTLVYVLNKQEGLKQDLIQIPPGPVQRPEVFYVNYNEGENPQLPFGIDLQTALASINSGQSNAFENGLGGGSPGYFEDSSNSFGSSGFDGSSVLNSLGSSSDDSFASKLYGPPKA